MLFPWRSSIWEVFEYFAKKRARLRTKSRTLKSFFPNACLDFIHMLIRRLIWAWRDKIIAQFLGMLINKVTDCLINPFLNVVVEHFKCPLRSRDFLKIFRTNKVFSGDNVRMVHRERSNLLLLHDRAYDNSISASICDVGAILISLSHPYLLGT